MPKRLRTLTDQTHESEFDEHLLNTDKYTNIYSSIPVLRRDRIRWHVNILEAVVIKTQRPVQSRQREPAHVDYLE